MSQHVSVYLSMSQQAKTSPNMSQCKSQQVLLQDNDNSGQDLEKSPGQEEQQQQTNFM